MSVRRRIKIGTAIVMDLYKAPLDASKNIFISEVNTRKSDSVHLILHTTYNPVSQEVALR